MDKKASLKNSFYKKECQFVHEELAEKRLQDGDAIPCCLKCKVKEVCLMPCDIAKEKRKQQEKEKREREKEQIQKESQKNVEIVAEDTSEEIQGNKEDKGYSLKDVKDVHENYKKALKDYVKYECPPSLIQQYKILVDALELLIVKKETY
jgi:hypothetical protein